MKLTWIQKFWYSNGKTYTNEAAELEIRAVSLNCCYLRAKIQLPCPNNNNNIIINNNNDNDNDNDYNNNNNNSSRYMYFWELRQSLTKLFYFFIPPPPPPPPPRARGDWESGIFCRSWGERRRDTFSGNAVDLYFFSWRMQRLKKWTTILIFSFFSFSYGNVRSPGMMYDRVLAV